MPAPDQLSALDASFLALDTPTAPLVVGWTMRFAGPAPPLAQLRRHLAARLHLVPRFRRRVVRPALGAACWEDVPGFDLADHVHAVGLRAPGGEEELRDVAGVLLSAPLPLDGPLWRLTLVRGPGNGFALVGQAHHALVDGIAAMQVALLLFGPAPAGEPAAAWAPAPAAERPPLPGRELVAGAVSRVSHPRSAVATGSHAVLGAARGLRTAGAAPLRDAAVALEALARRGPATSLQANRTHRREVAWARVELEAARAVGRRHGATVNDALLAACSLAFGRALRRRGEAPVALKVAIPVNVRGEAPVGAFGNRISLVCVDLPVSERDAVAALRQVRDRTRAVKAAGAAGPLDALSRAADGLPAAAQRGLARAVMGIADYAAVVSNVPGPPVELSLLGRPLRALLPSVPVPDGRGLTLGCISYAGELHLGLTADAEVVPDLAELAHDLERAWAVLCDEAPQAPTPWRARAARRREAPAAVRA